MSTAVDTAFEELMAAPDAGKPEHLICTVCYPPPVAPTGATVLCGFQLEAMEAITRRRSGRHKCARCLQVDVQSVYPCGH